MKKTTTAKEETSKASAEEKVKIAVYGSYDTEEKVQIDELNNNLGSIEGIDKSGLPVTELPATVIVDGYAFLIEQNGKVEISEPKPYEKTELEIEDIAKNPEKYYGAEVQGYTYPSNEIVKWRIFYAGKEPNGIEDNIYLIADDYIRYTAAPNGKKGTTITKGNTDYCVNLNNVYKDYEGGKCILENSLAANWLSKYFNYTEDEGLTYSNRESENVNIKAVAYMMDTTVWSVYAGEKAKYAIGGAPLEMYCESYKAIYPSINISCNIEDTKGYYSTKSSGLSSEYNKIYRKPETDKSNAMWIASPSNVSANNVLAVYYAGGIGGASINPKNIGICPVVCLKSGIQLKKIDKGVYSIKN